MRAQPQKSKKALIITTVIVAVALVGYGATAYSMSLWPFPSNSTNSTETGEPNTVNYGPPTDQETEDSQNAKKDNYNNSNPDENGANVSNGDTPVSNKTSVNVGVSFADIFESNLEVRAFTNGVVQAGTCTVTVTKDSKTVTETSGAFIDASSTQCEPVMIPKSKLSSGKWSVTVTYSSDSAYGVSEKIEVVIP